MASRAKRARVTAPARPMPPFPSGDVLSHIMSFLGVPFLLLVAPSVSREFRSCASNPLSWPEDVDVGNMRLDELWNRRHLFPVGAAYCRSFRSDGAWRTISEEMRRFIVHLGQCFPRLRALYVPSFPVWRCQEDSLFDAFPCLEHLTCKSIFCVSKSRRNLRSLRADYCGTEDLGRAFPCLEKLDVDDCTRLNHTTGIKTLAFAGVSTNLIVPLTPLLETLRVPCLYQETAEALTSHCLNLSSIRIDASYIDNGLAHLVRHGRNLRHVEADELTSEVLRALCSLGSGCLLESLVFTVCDENIYGDDIVDLCQALPRLHTLVVPSSGVHDEHIAPIATALPQLIRLGISHGLLSDAGLRTIGRGLKELRDLDIRDTTVTCHGVLDFLYTGPFSVPEPIQRRSPGVSTASKRRLFIDEDAFTFATATFWEARPDIDMVVVEDEDTDTRHFPSVVLLRKEYKRVLAKHNH